MRSLKNRDVETVESAEVARAPVQAPQLPASNPFRKQPSSSEDMLVSAGIEPDGRLNRKNQRLNAVSIGVPLAGTIAAFALIPWLSPTGWTWGVFAFFFTLNSLGAGVGLHRYFAHRAFEAPPAIVAILGVLGTWALQGPIARWVADHRRHHRFSDARFDPHSPYWNDEAQIRNRFRGWAHAHFLWMLSGKRSSEKRYASDVLSSPIGGFLTRFYWPVALGGLAVPAATGFLVGGGKESLLCFLWAGCARVALLHQLTWSVNSFGHMLGSKQSGSKDESRDSAVLALLMLGEGLHSYHHAHPKAAINRPLALDFGGLVILTLQRLGLACNVKKSD